MSLDGPRTVRRQDRGISLQQAEELLDRGEYGVLSTVGPDGQPYGVPLNYVYREGALYFHCALAGHKLDNLRHNARVSFCVVGATRVLPEQFATAYESAVVFGTAAEIGGPEREQALVWLLEKYCAPYLDEGRQYMAAKDRLTCVVKIVVSHVSGKARRA